MASGSLCVRSASRPPYNAVGLIKTRDSGAWLRPLAYHYLQS